MVQEYHPWIVKWEDSTMNRDDVIGREIPNIVIITSVGYIIKRTRRTITLTGDLYPCPLGTKNTLWRRVLTIPRKNIVTMSKL